MYAVIINMIYDVVNILLRNIHTWMFFETISMQSWKRSIRRSDWLFPSRFIITVKVGILIMLHF